MTVSFKEYFCLLSLFKDNVTTVWCAIVKESNFSDKLRPAMYVIHKCLLQCSHLWCLLAFSGTADSNFVWCYLMWCPANKHSQQQRYNFSNLSFWYHLHKLWAYCWGKQNKNVISTLYLLFYCWSTEDNNTLSFRVC